MKKSISIGGTGKHEHEQLEIERRLLESCKLLGDMFGHFQEACVAANNELDEFNRQYQKMKSGWEDEKDC